MSLTGIDNVKSTTTINVGVQKKGMTSRLVSNSAYVNTTLVLNNTHTENSRLSHFSSKSTINVKKSLTSPSSNFVNLGFDFINVESSLQSQNARNIQNNAVHLNVNNSLSYSHTSSKQGRQDYVTKVLNVLSSNTEYEITLSLDNKSLPQIEIFYPNVDERVEVELDEDTVWS